MAKFLHPQDEIALLPVLEMPDIPTLWSDARIECPLLSLCCSPFGLSSSSSRIWRTIVIIGIVHGLV
jgi:hypothetical protein